MLLLYCGEKHSGKTTAVIRLIERVRAGGFSAAGLLAPSVYLHGELVGFDALDIAGGRKCPLARLCEENETLPPGTVRAGRFYLLPEGLELGRQALESRGAADVADLVVVDEFGPLELGGGGWRLYVDGLLERWRGVVLLVVRKELTEDVRRLYADCAPLIVDATSAGEDEITRKILGILSRATRA